MMRCIKCGAELIKDARFCSECGEKVRRYCTECGREIALSQKNCSYCGASVNEGNLQEEKIESVLPEKQTETKEKIKDSGRTEDNADENSIVQKEDDLETMQEKESLKDDLPAENDLIENQKNVSYQDNLEEKQEETVSESDSGWQMKIGIPGVVRTKEDFLRELQQLVQQDKGSKEVVDFYGEKVFIKHVFSILNNSEKILKIRHIVHYNYANTFMRGGVFNTKEFLVITNKRVIKFVKSFWLKPKIKSCYLSEIIAVEGARAGGRLHGIFIGEKLKINSSAGQISLRTMGRGSADKVKLDILQAMNENNIRTSPAELNREYEINYSAYKPKRKLGVKGIIAGCAAILIVGCVLFFLWAGSGTEVSDYILSPKDDVIKFISEQELVDEHDLGMYSNDGLCIMLTEKGTIYTIIIRSPEYKLYGITIGNKFDRQKYEKNLLEHGYVFVDKLEGVKETSLYYSILRDGKPNNEQMIEICIDENNKVTAVAYGREDAEIYSELDIEFDNEDIIGDVENEKLDVDEGMIVPETYSEEVSQGKAENLAKQFEGQWWDLNSQRCYMDVEAAGGNKVFIVVSWSNGYADDSKWEMTGQVNGRNGRIVYKDCIQYDIHYDEYEEEQTNVNYTDGSGFFYLGNDGYLYWEDEVEGAGAGCYFEKDESIGVQETTGYTQDVPLGNGTRMYVVQCNASITLRNAPSTDAAEITQIPLYAAVDYYGTLDNGFAQISYNGQLGYVLNSFLDSYEPQVYTGTKCQIVNCNQSVTLRTSVTAQDKEICQIPLNTIVDYIDSGANGYFLVNYNGMMGYVKAEYLMFLQE